MTYSNPWDLDYLDKVETYTKLGTETVYVRRQWLKKSARRTALLMHVGRPSRRSRGAPAAACRSARRTRDGGVASCRLGGGRGDHAGRRPERAGRRGDRARRAGVEQAAARGGPAARRLLRRGGEVARLGDMAGWRHGWDMWKEVADRGGGAGVSEGGGRNSENAFSGTRIGGRNIWQSAVR